LPVAYLLELPLAGERASTLVPTCCLVPHTYLKSFRAELTLVKSDKDMVQGPNEDADSRLQARCLERRSKS
jgi:hypothetical protein